MVVSTELPKERRERRNVGAPPPHTSYNDGQTYIHTTHRYTPTIARAGRVGWRDERCSRSSDCRPQIERVRDDWPSCVTGPRSASIPLLMVGPGGSDRFRSGRFDGAAQREEGEAQRRRPPHASNRRQPKAENLGRVGRLSSPRPPPRSLQVALVELKIVDLDEVSLKIVRLSAGDPQPVTQGGAGTLTDIP